jgi:beta-lactamase regulating signal transducer with metallopeptidase domain
MIPLTELWRLAGWTMLHYLWIGLAIGAVAVIVRIALRRTSPIVRYSAQLVMFAMLAFAPLVIAARLAPTSNNNSREATLRGVPQADVRAQTHPVATPSVADHRSPAIVAQSQPVTPQTALQRWTFETIAHALPWLWLAGAPLTFALLASGVLGVERLKRSAQLLTTGPVREACDRLTLALRVSQRTVVAISDAVAQPVLVGIVRPLILLPAALVAECSPEQLELVLAHELAHVRRRDNLVNLVQRIVESVLFFQPAVWLVSHWLRRDREECCDALVVAATGRPQQYAELLYAVAANQSPWQLGAAMARHPVAVRIRKILNLPEETMLVPRRVLLGFVTACAALLLTVATYLPSVRAEEAKGTAKDAKSAKETEAAKPKFAKEEYRYEGKTFEEWNKAWRTELSESRRIEAVKALREFARVGYEREAIETILDVAEEYEFQVIANKGVKQTIVDQFTGGNDSSDALPAEVWLPMMDQRARKNPEKYKHLPAYTFRTFPDKVGPLLKNLAFDTTSPLRRAAQWDLVDQEMRRCSQTKEQWPSPLVLKVMELKADDTSARWQWILEMTDPIRSGGGFGGGGGVGSRLVGQGWNFPELTSLLLSTDKDLRSKARAFLVRLDDAEKKNVSTELLKQLDTEQSVERILAILRGLCRFGERIPQPTPRLLELAAYEDESIAIAALSYIHGLSIAGKPTSSGVFGREEIVWWDPWLVEYALKGHPIELTSDRWGWIQWKNEAGMMLHRILKPEERAPNRRPLEAPADLGMSMVQVVAFPDGTPETAYPELTPEELAFLKHYQRLCKIRAALYAD